MKKKKNLKISGIGSTEPYGTIGPTGATGPTPNCAFGMIYSDIETKLDQKNNIIFQKLSEARSGITFNAPSTEIQINYTGNYLVRFSLHFTKSSKGYVILQKNYENISATYTSIYDDTQYIGGETMVNAIAGDKFSLFIDNGETLFANGTHATLSIQEIF